jgi:hypothetical protein
MANLFDYMLLKVENKVNQRIEDIYSKLNILKKLLRKIRYNVIVPDSRTRALLSLCR